VVIGEPLARYFDQLRQSHGIILGDRQKAWYAKKAETQLADMKREYPSTPQEAFEGSLQGAYYAEQMAQAELQGRVGDYPALTEIPVHTVWDIGVGDYTAIWFFQLVAGRPRVVHYFQDSGEGMPYYLAELDRLAKRTGWQYGGAYLPHDGRVREWGTGRTRLEQITDHGFRARIVPLHALHDGINAVRVTLPLCSFDAAGCADGLKALKAYRKEWDEEHGVWLDRPRHDWSSHGADAFRGLAMCWRAIPPESVEAKPASDLIYRAEPDGRLRSNMSVMDWVKERQRRKRRGD
jgi:hypothetical protein